jgi:hypothetical protein
MEDGSLARFLIFLTDDDYPDRQDDVEVGVIPDNIIAGLQSIVAGYGVDAGELPDLPMMSDVAPDPYTVPTTEGAAMLLKALSNYQTNWLRSKRGTNETSVVARCAENAKKIALIRAISDCPSNPIITEENVKWATKLVKHCINILLREAKYNVADSANGTNINLVLDFLRKKGGFATTKQIGDAIRSIKGDDRAKLLRDMVETGLLTLATKDTGGTTPATVYTASTVH